MQSAVVNQTEIARLLDVTPKTIRAWEVQGCPVEAPSTRRGAPALYSVAAVVQWREEVAARAASGALAAMDMEEARRRKLAAEAALVELDLAKRRDEVVEMPITAEEVGAGLSAVRARLMAIGATVAPKLILAADTASRKEIIDDEVNQALAEISGPDFLPEAESKEEEEAS